MGIIACMSREAEQHFEFQKKKFVKNF